MSDWWLSPFAHTPAYPSLPHLEWLSVDVMRLLNEATLAVLLDAAPQLQELTLHSAPLPYDVLLWIGDRCHQLQTLVMTVMETSGIHYSWQLAAKRWDRMSASPALPLLTTQVPHTVP